MSLVCMFKRCNKVFCPAKDWIDAGCDRGFGKIVWGVHPLIREALERRDPPVEPVVVVLNEDHFCQEHILSAYRMILDLIGRFPEIAKEINHSSELVEGLGCWITIFDRLNKPAIENFQFSYDSFKMIFELFHRLP